MAPLWIAAAALGTNLLLALFLIPPWQNPDEPQHLDAVRRILRFGPDYSIDVHDTDGERAIVASMAEHSWWEHYGLRTPSPLPESFAEGPAKVVGDYFGPPGGGSRLYYRVIAAAFRATGMTGTSDLVREMYLMRVVSACAGLLALYFVWAGSRVVLGDFGGTVVAALVAVHPQFAIVSTTAGPDALVNLAGAAFWAGAAGVIASKDVARNVLLIWASAFLAFVMRRSGASLVVFAAGLMCLPLVRLLRAQRSERSSRAAAIGLAIPVASTIAWPFLPADVHRAFDWIHFDVRSALATVAANASELPRFLGTLYRTFWFAAGWLRHPAPGWWYAVTEGIVAITVLGLLRGASSTTRRTAICAAVTMLLLQVVIVIAYDFGVLRSGPQGRYLFVVLAPVWCLMWIGWNNLVGRFCGEGMAAALLIAALALLNAVAWTTVVAPAFA